MKTNFKIASYRKYEITFSCTWQNGNVSTDTVTKIGISNAMKARRGYLNLARVYCSTDLLTATK